MTPVMVLLPPAVEPSMVSVVPAVAVAMRGFPQGLAAFPAPAGTTVTVALADADAAWTVGCDGERIGTLPRAFF